MSAVNQNVRDSQINFPSFFGFCCRIWSKKHLQIILETSFSPQKSNAGCEFGLGDIIGPYV